eukprot:9873641-Alexandrium_andersonii.AAC.1
MSLASLNLSARRPLTKSKHLFFAISPRDAVSTFSRTLSLAELASGKSSRGAKFNPKTGINWLASNSKGG